MGNSCFKSEIEDANEHFVPRSHQTRPVNNNNYAPPIINNTCGNDQNINIQQREPFNSTGTRTISKILEDGCSNQNSLKRPAQVPVTRANNQNATKLSTNIRPLTVPKPATAIIHPISKTANEIELLENPNLTYNKNLVISNDDRLYGLKIFIGRLSEKSVLVKVINKYQKSDMEAEIRCLSSLSHSNIANILFKIETPESFFTIIYDYGSLLSSSISRYSQVQKKQIMLQLITAVKYLQDKNIVHLDIHPKSILINNILEPPHVKLFNFHKAKDMRRNNVVYFDGSSMMEGYTAPELYRNAAFLSSDIYSLGCLFFSIITDGLKMSFARIEQDATKLEARINSMISENSSFDVLSKDLVRKMVVYAPDSRIDASSAIDHPFFWSADKIILFIIEISNLIEKYPTEFHAYLFKGGKKVIQNDWIAKLEDETVEKLTQARKDYQNKTGGKKQEDFNGKSIISFMKMLRNTFVHPQKEELTRIMGSNEDFVNYWSDKFPHLILHLYKSKNDFENKVPLTNNKVNNKGTKIYTNKNVRNQRKRK